MSQHQNPVVKVAKDIFAGTAAGPIDCVKKTVQWEGLRGLYKASAALLDGVTSPLAGQIVFRSVLFGAFGQSKQYLAKDSEGNPRQLTYADFYKAGAITGGVAAFAEGPIDFYKSQIQVQIIRSKSDPNYKPAYTTVGDCVRATIRTNGIRGPAQGLPVTILRNVPANSIYLGSFEVIKDQLAKSKGCTQAELPAWQVISAGGVGGLMYWLTVYPLDVIKSAQMTDAIEPSQRKYPTIAVAFQKLMAEGGIGRFYRGFTPCIARAAPANGIMLWTVDKANQMLKN
eukprot:jgi/Astpho2/5968/Aster-02449